MLHFKPQIRQENHSNYRIKQINKYNKPKKIFIPNELIQAFLFLFLFYTDINH